MRDLCLAAGGLALAFTAGFATAPRPNPAAGEVGARGAVDKAGATGEEPPSALGKSGPGAAAMFSRVAAAQGLGGFSKLRATMRLIDDCRPGEFEALLAQLAADFGTNDDFGLGEMVFARVFKRWTEADAAGLAEALVSRRSHLLDQYESGAFFALAAAERAAVSEVWTALRAAGDPSRRVEMSRRYLQWLADRDPLGALRLAADLDRFSEADAITEVLDKAAAADPRAALAFVENLPSGPLGTRVRSRHVIGVNSISVLPGGGFSESIGTEMLRGNNLFRTVAGNWTRKEPAAALAWAEGLDPARRAAVMPALMASWLATEPEAALAYAAEHLRGAAALQFNEAAMATSEVPLERRREIAETGPFRATRGRLKFTVDWLSDDTTAAAAWLAEQPREPALEVMRRAAGDWGIGPLLVGRLDEIADAELREAAMESLLQGGSRYLAEDFDAIFGSEEEGGGE